MNLPGPSTATPSDSKPVISTYSILLLSGMLFGICVSGSVPAENKLYVTLTGTLGLVAYLVISLAKHKQKQQQLRRAAQQVEDRLDRHSHVDVRADNLRAAVTTASTNPA